ncbi:sulfite exporter TauE/SafE family protein [Crocosphaera sp.]|uniref:sulfite exporter TauE/SafE family protein n=1 Tax=Crocosphaera sp. TaxID=2729996 RepID=UPI003F237922|nr:sulfite exporter TauE/SafE family protein [Crocosphaera sp.]
MDNLFVPLIILLGVFIQSLSGFGLGVVSMPLITLVIDVRVASPLMNLISLLTLLIISVYYRNKLEIKAIFRLVIASSLAIPFGVYFLKNIDQTISSTILGMVVLGYGIYSLLEFPLPSIRSPKWGYGFAFCSGLLSGAYNTGGPPMIIYGNCCRWTPEQFRSNLNFFFFCNVIIVLTNHFLQGNITPEVLQLFMISIPMIVIGLILGFSLSKRVNLLLFRKLVLILLSMAGLQLLIQVMVT